MRARPASSALTLALALAATLTLTACGGLGGTGVTTTSLAPPDPAHAPTDVHWEAFQGIQLPIGAHDGPTKIGTTASGYSHTPQGAALAAINHTVRLSLAPDSSWPEVASQSLMPGPAKDSWVLSRAQISVTAPADPAVAPRISGYKIATYDPIRTDITIYTTYPDASIAATLQTVEWSADDWRLRLPDPNSKTTTVQSIPAIPEGIVRLEPPK
ncbi:hypothetical protein OHB26_24525 [Nocardia sp. NBC_01503]|uniref:hypothetical protein n=1 Tax=Nocardia sp. NBC_01503 TaxID=2975997 RepID=UPI002E7C132B|nr:hypothetical protein [Nocardia sp. NBC_01503]WTL30111.1 hypothetical protein OHB26_24525 [Nocardia sp. NBC_01503]